MTNSTTLTLAARLWAEYRADCTESGTIADVDAALAGTDALYASDAARHGAVAEIAWEVIEHQRNPHQVWGVLTDDEHRQVWDAVAALVATVAGQVRA